MSSLQLKRSLLAAQKSRDIPLMGARALKGLTVKRNICSGPATATRTPHKKNTHTAITVAAPLVHLLCGFVCTLYTHYLGYQRAAPPIYLRRLSASVAPS